MPAAGRISTDAPALEIARDAVSALAESLPDNAEVALRAYGHRKNARQEGADEASMAQNRRSEFEIIAGGDNIVLPQGS